MIAPQAFNKENNLKKVPFDSYDSDTEDNVKTIKESGEALAGHIKEDTINIAHSVAAEGQEKIKEMKSYAGGYLDMIEHEVSAKPVQSLAIAFVSGFFINLLLGRR